MFNIYAPNHLNNALSAKNDKYQNIKILQNSKDKYVHSKSTLVILFRTVLTLRNFLKKDSVWNYCTPLLHTLKLHVRDIQTHTNLSIAVFSLLSPKKDTGFCYKKRQDPFH